METGEEMRSDLGTDFFSLFQGCRIIGKKIITILGGKKMKTNKSNHMHVRFLVLVVLVSTIFSASAIGAEVYYEVWRSPSSDPGNIIRLPNATWLQTTTYDDYTAVPGEQYYYWVRVITAETVSGYYHPLNFNLDNWLICPTEAQRGESIPFKATVEATAGIFGAFTPMLQNNIIEADNWPNPDDIMKDWSVGPIFLTVTQTYHEEWTKDIVVGNYETDATAEVGLKSRLDQHLWCVTAVANVTLRDSSDNPPSGIDASDGTYTDKVRVTWDSVSASENRNSDISSGNIGWISPSQPDNNPPILYNPRVIPSTGTIVDDYEYLVDYYDMDGDAPAGGATSIWVSIDGGANQSMQLKSGYSYDGTYHLPNINLDEDSHDYSFSTVDERGAPAQIGPFNGPYVDVPPPGSFEVLGFTLDDSPSICYRNDGDSDFQSSEQIHIRPLIQYNGILPATYIDVKLLYTGSELEITQGDRRYPDLGDGDSAYPENNGYFWVHSVDYSFAGTVYLDVQIDWDESGTPVVFDDAIELVVEPAPVLRVTPVTWDFGVSSPGDDITHTMNVHNQGSGLMTVTDVQTSNTDTSVSPADKSFTLAPGSNRDILITIDTASIANGTTISREVQVVSGSRLSEEEPPSDRTSITGLISDSIPIFQIPGVTTSWEPDISNEWIVWDEDRYGNWDIFAYNIGTDTEIQVTNDSARQSTPRISGNLIAWEDLRNGDTWQRDIYGYDLGTGQEFIISDDPAHERLIGVDNGKVAFGRIYHEITEPSSHDTKLYNLWLYDYGTQLSTNVTGFTSNTSHSPMHTIWAGDADFGDDLLVWHERTMQWTTFIYDHWEATDSHADKMKIGVDGSGVRVLENAENPYPRSSSGTRFVWLNDDDKVWLWDQGVKQQITSEDGDDDAMAIGDRFIVYRTRFQQEVFYWDIGGSQELLLTDQVSDAEAIRMDGDSVVWWGRDSNSLWHVYYAFLQQSDIAVASENMIFSNDTPYEGSTIDVNCIVRNLTDYDSTEDITVRLYDGDPNSSTQLGSDVIISDGIAAKDFATVTFSNVPVGIEGAHNIHLCIYLPSFDNPANNTASKILNVLDTDIEGPVISNVMVQEYNGDGDGLLDDNEQILISWSAADISGIDSSWCTIDGNDVLASGTFYVIIGPYVAGDHDFTISALDGDTSPVTSLYYGGFTVHSCDFNLDGMVNFGDFVIIANYWQQECDSNNSFCEGANIYASDFIDVHDLSVFCECWLKGTESEPNEPNDPIDIAWVSIDDPGVSGHEGFHGEMSKYETTNAQYCQFLNDALASGDIAVDVNDIIGASGSNGGTDFVGEVYYDLAGSGYTLNGATNGGAARINYTGSSFTVDSGFENHPVTYVSWYGATSFSNYYGFRLPTKWEWQAVADYNGSYIYGCGITINNSIANYYNSTHPDGTTVVGSFGSYGYGMCDMAGNVWEWTSNGFAPSGCWSVNANDCEVSSTHSHTPDYTDDPIGFRVCVGTPAEIGVVAYWSSNAGSGTTLTDDSGNGHDGSINGATWVDGISGKALSFNGSGDYVNLPSDSNLSFTSPSEPFSTSFWIKPDSVIPSDQTILENEDDYLISLYGGVLSYRKTDSGNLYHNCWQSTNPEISAGIWSHIVITYDGTGAGGTKMYVNGEEKPVTNTTYHGGGSPSGDNFAIGIYASDFATAPFGGEIDEVRIYNRVLTPAEICVVAYWSSNAGSGTTLTDDSGNGHDGSINGATWVDGISGKALSFNGSGDYVNLPSDSNLSFTSPSEPFSTSFWIKPDSVIPSDQTILENEDDYLISLYGGVLSYRKTDSGNLYHNCWQSTNPEISAGIWSHIVITYDGTGAGGTKMYVNGEEKPVTTGAYHGGGSASGDDFAIGIRAYDFADAPYGGEIDEILIYNRVLTSTEIEYLNQKP